LHSERREDGPQPPDWLHEIKHDGYRLIVQRDGKRVRLWTRTGHDWSGRFPLIAEAALRNRNSSFVIDGEAVLLGVDGRSDFNGLHSRRHDHEVEFYAFDILVSDGEDVTAARHAQGQPRPAAGAEYRESIYRGGRSDRWVKVKLALVSWPIVVAIRKQHCAQPDRPDHRIETAFGRSFCLGAWCKMAH
jgi:ATP-dependent DNA ligase